MRFELLIELIDLFQKETSGNYDGLLVGAVEGFAHLHLMYYRSLCVVKKVSPIFCIVLACYP